MIPPRILSAIVMTGVASLGLSMPQRPPASPATGHYLFAWTGDPMQGGKDFLAVIDADPASSTYGHLVTTVVTDQQTQAAHHTEYTMPASAMLFANDHPAGRTFIFDLRDPIHPTVASSFTDVAAFMHPHSYVRLPNGHVLATFQHTDQGHGAMSMGHPVAPVPGASSADASPTLMSMTGGLVEIDDLGNVVRAVSAADPAFAGALLTPYSLVVLPELDRVVSTNSSMDGDYLFRGLTYQVWRLSDLKLLKTAYFDTGDQHFGQVSPEEPRRGPDGSVFVQTLACGLERITDLDTDRPVSRLVHVFPGSFCGVPTIVGHYLIQSDPSINGLIALDIAKAATPSEASRLILSDDFQPHWTGWDVKTHRLVVTGSALRLLLVKLDEETGQLSLDEAFHDESGKPGFDFSKRTWPHGWTGPGLPHGVVFSR